MSLPPSDSEYSSVNWRVFLYDQQYSLFYPVQTFLKRSSENHLSESYIHYVSPSKAVSFTPEVKMAKQLVFELRIIYELLFHIIKGLRIGGWQVWFNSIMQRNKKSFSPLIVLIFLKMWFNVKYFCFLIAKMMFVNRLCRAGGQTLNQAHQNGLTDLPYVEMMHGIEKGSGKWGKGLVCSTFYMYLLFYVCKSNIFVSAMYFGDMLNCISFSNQSLGGSSNWSNTDRWTLELWFHWAVNWDRMGPILQNIEFVFSIPNIIFWHFLQKKPCLLSPKFHVLFCS